MLEPPAAFHGYAIIVFLRRRFQRCRHFAAAVAAPLFCRFRPIFRHFATLLLHTPLAFSSAIIFCRFHCFAICDGLIFTDAHAAIAPFRCFHFRRYVATILPRRHDDAALTPPPF